MQTESVVNRTVSPLGRFVRTVSRAVDSVDGLLTPRRAFHYPLLFLVVTAAVYVAILVGGTSHFDAFGKPILVDYAAHATGGRLALEGRLDRRSENEHQVVVQREMLEVSELRQPDIYLSPPFVAYLYAPFSVAPYGIQVGIWLGLTVVLFWLSLQLLWPLVPGLHQYSFVRVAIVASSSTATVEMLAAGQDSALSLLLFVVGLRLLMARRDMLAGAVLAFGLFKPQLFVFVPVLLLCQRRWRALAGWVIVASVLAGWSVILLGPSGTREYAELLTSDVYRLGIAGPLSWKMLSLPALLRGLHLGSAAPVVIAVVATVLIVAFRSSALE